MIGFDDAQTEESVMRGLVQGLPAWRLLCAAAFLCLAPAVHAAETDKGSSPAESGVGASKPEPGTVESAPNDSEASGPKGTEGEAEKPKEDGAEKPKEGETPPPEEKASDQGPPPGTEGEGRFSARLKDLIGDGFLIRTTVLVPAEAVTRQTGRISSDAIIVTLQKDTAIAVCYYTLKAYVKGGKGLTKIASCTVYR